MKRKNTTLATIFTSLTLTSFIPVTANAAPEEQPAPPIKCAPVQIIGVPGSGATHSAADPEAKQEMQPGWNIAKELEEKHGSDNVHGITVPYPASLGYAYSALALKGTSEGYIGGYEGVSYGPSVKMGVEWAENYITQTSKECGADTKWVIYGFSQGADVAGDIASDISSGKVEGVNPDNVIAVALISDPNRSATATNPRQGNEKLTMYAPAPQGVVQSNGEIIKDAKSGRVGAAGARETDFSNLYGKVLSLCDDADFPCANNPGSIMTDIAKIAEKGTGFTLTESQMKSISEVISTIQGGNIDPAQVVKTVLPLIGDIKNLVPEVHKVVVAAKPVIDNSQDKEGWVALFSEFEPKLEGIKKVPGINIIAKPIVDIVNDVLSLKPQGEITEEGKKSFEQFMQGVTAFQSGTHVSYFKASEGQSSSADDVREWISIGVENALKGSTMHLSIDEITASISGKDIPATQGEENTNSTPNPPVETSPIVPEISIPKPTQEAKPTQDSIPSNHIKDESVHPGLTSENKIDLPESNPQNQTVTSNTPAPINQLPVTTDEKATDSPNPSFIEETDLTDSTINPQPAPSSQKMLATTGANVFLISGLGALIALAGLFMARFNRKKNRTA